MYVIQSRVTESQPWFVVSERYKSMGEAKSALELLNPLLKIHARIAEEYTVTRYKAVKL